MVGGDLQHPQMDHGVLVSGEADVADLSRLFGVEKGLHRAVGRKDAVGIFEANDFVMLHQVDVIDAETA